VALNQANLFGTPEMVENFLQHADLPSEVKEKIMQLARKRDIERRWSGFQKKLNEFKNFLNEEFEEEISRQIDTIRIKGERKLREERHKVLSSEPKPLTPEEAREVLNSVYERLVGEK